MIQKCSIIKTLEVFFKSPTKIHFIREISREIRLAPTSIRNYIKELEEFGLIQKKKNNPFDGFIANRDNDQFIYYKRAYNLYSLYELKKEIVESLYPNAIIIFGSYSRGDDTENSDIDILILSKAKKNLKIENFEKKLRRKINIMYAKDLNELEKPIKDNVLNGFIIHGGI